MKTLFGSRFSHVPRSLGYTVLVTVCSLLLSAQAQERQPAPVAVERPEYAINASGRISTRGLLAEWRGDGDATDRRDKSPGTAHGGVSYSPAMAGRGFHFDGVDGGISVGDTEPLRIAGSLTISAWVYIEAFPSTSQRSAMIVFRGDDRPGLDPYYLEVSAAKELRFVVDDGTTGPVSIAAPIGAGRFVLVTATLDHATGRLRLYENGRVVAASTTAATPLRDLDPAQNPGIGIGNHGGWPNSPYRYPFHGILNDILIYDRALTPSEIIALYDDRMSVPTL